MPADLQHIKKHYLALCETIGNRLCGHPGEQQAADYIESVWAHNGLENVRQEPFRFPNWRHKKIGLWVGKAKPTRRTPCGPMVYSASTPVAGVQGPLVYLQSGHKHDFNQNLKGKIGLLIGSLSLQDETLKRRLVASGLRGLLVVDNRFAHDLTYAAGAAPQWIGNYTLPTVTVPFTVAGDLVKGLPLTARMRVDAEFSMDLSQNVVGDITGSAFKEEVVAVTAHHDCVHGTVGADDNGTGVVTLLELARVLRKKKPRRTIRLISYGVEERLSVGSYLHWRRMHARERRQVRFVVNIDLGGHVVGEDRVVVTGTPQLVRYVSRLYERRQHPAVIQTGQMIYSDQFAPNLYGVPSIYASRRNLAGGYVQHVHTTLDSLENISYPVVARTIDTLAELVTRVADVPKMPFPRRISANLAREVRNEGTRAYRHPWPIKTVNGLATFMPPDDRFK